MSTCRRVVAAALVVGAYAQYCPEPIKQLLGKGELWGLEVHEADCAAGEDPVFHGVTPSGYMYGHWAGFCALKDTNPNVDLIITTEPRGLGDGCSTNEDCSFIPCKTGCLPCTDESCKHSHECMATGDDCRANIWWNIKPSDLKSACPPDPRDTICMEGVKVFDDMGCDIFVDAVDHARPPTPGMGQIAAGCLQVLNKYTGCVTEKFEDSPAYLMHRMPRAEVFSYINNATVALTTDKCVAITQEKAIRTAAVPCGEL
mmetsp:Transcript_60357/g.169210  ORF Transcript_60357/g.169210 Transcript_60357/m.169210 type:complete len:258 (+) Transcript_60357:113-886(+)